MTYLRGWYGYFRFVELPWRMRSLSKWIRRPIRKLFWLRWHRTAGRCNALRRLGLPSKQVRLGGSSRGTGRMAAHAVMHTALSNKRRRTYRFLTPSDLAEASGSEMSGERKDRCSSAGCGKPLVRWCGRGDGRHPVTSTRSRFCHWFVRRFRRS